MFDARGLTPALGRTRPGPSDEPMAHQISSSWNPESTCNNSSIENGNYKTSSIMQFGTLSSKEKCCKNLKKLLSVVPLSESKIHFAAM